MPMISWPKILTQLEKRVKLAVEVKPMAMRQAPSSQSLGLELNRALPSSSTGTEPFSGALVSGGNGALAMTMPAMTRIAVATR